MISQKPTTLNIVRHSSHIALKNNILAQIPQIQDFNDSKELKKKSFWMKRVPRRNMENISSNYLRPTSKARTSNQSKIRTLVEESIDKKEKNQNQLYQINSKLNIILKHQSEITQEIKLTSLQKNIKLQTYQKNYSSLSKLLYKVINIPPIQSISSLGAILKNHIQYSSLIFEKILNQCDFLRQKKTFRPIQQVQKLQYQNKKMLSNNLKLIEQNILLKNLKNYQDINISQFFKNKLQSTKIDYLDLDYQKLLVQNITQTTLSNVSQYSLKQFTQHFWAYFQTNLQNQQLNNSMLNIEIHSYLFKKFIQSAQSIRLLSYLEKFKNNLSLKKNQFNFPTMKNTSLIQLSLYDITISRKFDFQIFSSLSKFAQNSLNNIKKFNSPHQQSKLSLRQLVILINQSSFINNKLQNQKDFLQQSIEIITKVRLENNQLLKKQFLQNFKSFQKLYKKHSTKTSFYTNSAMTSIRNKGLSNCMNLLEQKTNQYNIKKYIQSTDQIQDCNSGQNNSIYLKKIDCILCIYYFFYKQLQKIKNDLTYILFTKSKSINQIILLYFETNLTITHNFINQKATKHHINKIVQFFQLTYSYRNNQISIQQKNILIIQFITYNYVKNAVLKKYQSQSDLIKQLTSTIKKIQ